LLLEPQRSNLVTFSEQFANWSNAGGTTTANTAISPSGYQDADTLTGARFQSSFASNTYTASCFAKKVDGDNKLVLRFDVPTLKFAQFDLNTGTIDSVSTDYSATITPYGNGWYRCTLTSPAATAISNFVIISASGGVSNTYVWGAQLEAGAYATSYIPTLGASVTRVTEACSKTGVSSLIGQTAGSVFVEAFVQTGQESQFFWLRNPTGFYTDFMAVIFNVSRQVEFSVVTGGTTQVFITSAAVSQGFHKVAIGYANNDFVLYIDGVQIGTDSSGTPPTCSDLFIDQFIDGGLRNVSKKQALLFKTRLTNAQLAELTA
jgi:hypothetical protein